MVLQDSGDVGRVLPELEAPEDEQRLGAVGVAGVDLDVGGREPEPTHPHHPHRVDSGPRPPAYAAYATQLQTVGAGREARPRETPDGGRDGERDRRQPDEQTTGWISGPHGPGRETGRGHDAECDRRTGRRPRAGQFIHSGCPQWGRMTTVLFSATSWS